MFKLRKCCILRKILLHFEFDGNNTSQESWDKTKFTTMKYAGPSAC